MHERCGFVVAAETELVTPKDECGADKIDGRLGDRRLARLGQLGQSRGSRQETYSRTAWSDLLPRPGARDHGPPSLVMMHGSLSHDHAGGIDATAKPV